MHIARTPTRCRRAYDGQPGINKLSSHNATASQTNASCSSIGADSLPRLPVFRLGNTACKRSAGGMPPAIGLNSALLRLFNPRRIALNGTKRRSETSYVGKVQTSIPCSAHAGAHFHRRMAHMLFVPRFS